MLATLGGHDASRIPEVLDLVGLGGRGSDRFGEYSFGMKQRLGIAAALLGDPALLVLDEPTNGLDPAGINEMREFIRSVGDGERTVLVSSHILSELEQVCDWLIVIDRGSLVYQGPTQGFLGETSTVIALAPEHLGDLERLAALVRADGHEPRHRGRRADRAGRKRGRQGGGAGPEQGRDRAGHRPRRAARAPAEPRIPVPRRRRGA